MLALQEEVVAAQPDIDKRTEQLVSKGRWQVPGYKVRVTRSIASGRHTDQFCRRNSVTCRCCRGCSSGANAIESLVHILPISALRAGPFHEVIASLKSDITDLRLPHLEHATSQTPAAHLIPKDCRGI